jgi:amino acid transporter
MSERQSVWRTVKNVMIGGSRSPTDKRVFHQISLIAFFAWVGLGVDGLSSSCYGPQEAFQVLGKEHMYLGLFVAMGTALTVFVISSGYSQIVELFPSGGGGYLVASKLLSPSVGMLSGCALLIDYVLTIAVSIASGADALFSLSVLAPWQEHKLAFAMAGVALLTIVNLRGVRESVVPLVPIFLVFILTHAFIIIYAIVVSPDSLPTVAEKTSRTLTDPTLTMGAMFLLVLKAYSMGAGTFTGIEAVSNGLPMLREPRVQTAKKTMHYMAFSLVFTAGGLMIAYVLHSVQSTPRQTSNAVLLHKITDSWGHGGEVFVLVALISEAVILFVAAQTGFLGGPRVMSNMALDRWLPSRLALLSDRLVTSYGIVLMGVAAAILVATTRGHVGILVVLYSINVFITFVLSLLGMVRHWTTVRGRAPKWRRKLFVSALGLVLCSFILVSMVILKFNEGGWITLLITGSLVVLALAIRRHYRRTQAMLKRLDALVDVAEMDRPSAPVARPAMVPNGKTAVILVNGFNGLGLHSLFAVTRLFGDTFKNYAFIQVGAVDAGTFKGVQEMEDLEKRVAHDVQRYVDYMARMGIYADGYSTVSVDVVEEILKFAVEIQQRMPDAVFFGGQLVFTKDSVINRLLHNHIVFSVQRRLYTEGIPCVILPIRV